MSIAITLDDLDERLAVFEYLNTHANSQHRKIAVTITLILKGEASHLIKKWRRKEGSAQWY